MARMERMAEATAAIEATEVIGEVSGMGILPMHRGKTAHGQDAHATQFAVNPASPSANRACTR